MEQVYFPGKPLLLYIFCTLIINFTSYAQKPNFVEGHYIDQSGKQVNCQIDKKSLKGLVQEVNILKNSSPTTLKPGDCQGFSLKGSDVYKSKRIKVEGDSQQVFLLEMVSGPASLYLAKPNLNEQLVFVEKDGQLYQFKENHEKGLIGFLTEDCGEITPSHVSKLRTNNLIAVASLIQKYNECIDPEGGHSSVIKQEQRELKVYKSIALGLNSAGFRGKNHQYNGWSFPRHHFITGGLQLYIPFSPKFGLQPEALFAHFSYSEQDKSHAFYQFVSESLQLEFTGVHFPVSFKYHFKSMDRGLYLMAGPTVHWFFLQNNVQKETSIPAFSPNFHTEFQQAQIGGIIGVGTTQPINEGRTIGFSVRYNYSRFKTRGYRYFDHQLVQLVVSYSLDQKK